MPVRIWCLTPNPVLETKFPDGRAVISAGGKGHNVARQLASWGVPAISLVPQAGRGWRKAAKKERADLCFLAVSAPARDGYAVTGVAGHRLDFFTRDPVWGLRDWSNIRGFLQRRLKTADWLVVAGSVPKGVPSGEWWKLFQTLKRKGVRLLVDSRGVLLREALQAGVDWAKANLAEAEGTMRQRGAKACLAGMRNLARGRCGLLLTRGSRGLVMLAGTTTMVVPAPKIQVQDATGSGDVVTAALIYGIHQGWEIGKVAGFAVWAGSENAARRNEVVARLKGRGGFA